MRTSKFRVEPWGYSRWITTVVMLAGLALTACTNPSTGDGPSPSGPQVKVAVDEELRAMVPAKYRDSGVVRVATNAPFPPYEMFSGEGSQELVGLEIDLGRAIGSKLGVDFQFSQQPFDGLITGLQAHKYDVLMAALFDTKERQQVVDFIDYAKAGSAIMVNESNSDIKTLDDLCGKTVAVQSGSTQERFVGTVNAKCAAENKPFVDVNSFPQFSDEQLALTTGRVEAILHDLSALVYAASQTSAQGLVVLTDPAAPGGYDAANVAIGVAKDDTAMREAILGAVSGLIADGTYQEIFTSYSLQASMISKPTINQAIG